MRAFRSNPALLIRIWVVGAVTQELGVTNPVPQALPMDTQL